MAPMLSPAVRAFFDGPHFAVLSTVGRDGGPHASVMWVERDGDELLLATVLGRQKELNIRRDPRVSVTVFDSEQPYHYAEVRGIATIEPEGGEELNNRLARKYTGENFKYRRPGQVRVVIRVKANHTTGSATEH